MKDLSNSKLWIGNNPELSEKVQRRLFELKITWSDEYTNVIAKTSTCLFINFFKKITHASKNKKEFDSDSRKEIFLSDLFEEEWIPKVGETWKYNNDVYNYIIDSFCDNSNTIQLIRTDNGQITESYHIEHFKNTSLWKKISSIQEEDLSKVPYTEWRVGDIITPFLNWNDNGGLTTDKEYVITKFDAHNPYVIKNNGKEDWASYLIFKLVKRASNKSEDTFVLPEKWHIDINPSNADVLIGWRSTGGCSDEGMLLSFYDGARGYHTRRIENYPDFKTKITFEQFKKYVLKSSVESTDSIKQINNNLNKQENVNSKESTNSEGITKSVSRISGTSSTREELRGFNYGFEKSYRRQRIGITEVGSRRR